VYAFKVPAKRDLLSDSLCADPSAVASPGHSAPVAFIRLVFGPQVTIPMEGGFARPVWFPIDGTEFLAANLFVGTDCLIRLEASNDTENRRHFQKRTHDADLC